MKATSERSRQAELDRLVAMPDSEIDTSDIPELSDERWRSAVRGRSWRLACDLDPDVVTWFADRGDDYPAEMNRVLRAYMDQQGSADAAFRKRSA